MMTPEELEHMDLRVGDRVYIAEAGSGNLSVGDIVTVTALSEGRPYGAGCDLAAYGRRFYRLTRAGEVLAGMVTRSVRADGTLGRPLEWDGTRQSHALPTRVIVAYRESPGQAAKREALEELEKATKALARARAKVENLG